MIEEEDNKDDLIVFENQEQKILKFEELFNKRKDGIIGVKELDMNNNNNQSDILNESSTLENRMKNSNLFSQTPISLIRNKKNSTS